jgi:hypothetical protein
VSPLACNEDGPASVPHERSDARGPNNRTGGRESMNALIKAISPGHRPNPTSRTGPQAPPACSRPRCLKHPWLGTESLVLLPFRRRVKAYSGKHRAHRGRDRRKDHHIKAETLVGKVSDETTIGQMRWLIAALHCHWPSTISSSFRHRSVPTHKPSTDAPEETLKRLIGSSSQPTPTRRVPCTHTHILSCTHSQILIP